MSVQESFGVAGGIQFSGDKVRHESIEIGGVRS